MKRIPVQSEQLVSVGYEVNTHVLEVEFKDGSIYEIYEVSAEMYEYLMNDGEIRESYFEEHLKIENLCRQVYPATR